MYIIGMDGGGTGTKVVLMQNKQEILRLSLGGINYNSRTGGEIREEMKKLAGGLAEKGYQPLDCAGIGIGAAGISNPEAEPFLKEALRKAGFSCPVKVTGDDEAALLGGFGREAGILLIAGTGSACLAQDGHGSRIRVGGHGHLIDDEGSAYAVGRDMLSAVVRAWDGRGPRSELEETIAAQTGIQSVRELIAFVYGKNTGKKEIASLARGLTPELAERDRTAAQIAGKAAKELLLLVLTAQKKVLCPAEGLPLILQGSLIQNNRAIRSRFEKILSERSGLKIAEKKADAACGAASLLWE